MLCENAMHGIELATYTRGLRWQDAVDIVLLTLLFSAAYRSLRRTVAIQFVPGLAVLLLGSWLASHFGLILTSYLLSAVSAVATIIIVVVFQYEIRQGLNRVNPLRWLSRRGEKVARLDARQAIAQASFSIASRGKGALIVIPRRDSIVEHVAGGTLVEARLSPSLIEAIFTSPSPLHDGAVVVSNERVLQAGVLLPLATENEDPQFGTRHRAAIGLAAATDALVICVSEERGSVSLFHGVAIDGMADEAHLCEALRVLGAGNGRATDKGPARPRFRPLAAVPYLLILIGVVGAWAGLALDRSHATARIVPLEIREVSDALAFDPPRYSSIAVELRGSHRQLELLPPGNVDAFVDLAGATVGMHTFPVRTSAPAGIEVVSISPATVQMQIRARASPTPPPPPREPNEVAAVPDRSTSPRKSLRH